MCVRRAEALVDVARDKYKSKTKGIFMGGIKRELTETVVQEGIFAGTSRDLSAVRRAQQRGGNSDLEPAGELLAQIPLEVREELLGDHAVAIVMEAFPGAELVEE